MKLKLALLAIFLAVLPASNAHAQGTASWIIGYPKTGNNAGGILIKGTTTPDAGWTVTGFGSAVAWPTRGGATKQYPITVRADGTWGETQIGAGDLTSGTDYNVVVQITVKMGLASQSLATPVGVIKAK